MSDAPNNDQAPAKVGLDDFLVAFGPDALRTLLATAESAKKPTDDRPKVELVPWEYVSIGQAVEAMAKGDRGLYQRGGELVRVVNMERPPLAVNQEPTASKIEPLPLADLRTRLTRYANIVETHVRKDGSIEEQPAHPPDWLVKGVALLRLWPGVRPLEAIVTAPTLLPDGSVVQQPGYHAASGLLYIPDGDFPAIPDAPTKADALAAVGAVLEVVADFPFRREEHRAAWLAALLTLAGRFAFHGPSPLFLVDANVRAAGKGLLVDCIALIVLGRVLGRTAYPDDDDNEMRKLILSIALEGDRAVLLDNLAGSLGCPSLDAALTSITWEGRVLCTNNKPRLPLVTVWFATGNNISVLADTGRRIANIRLEAPDERPEERTDFKHPVLLEWVRSNRPRLLAATLTILRAYILARMPGQGLKEWGSFEGWTKLVRGAVVWCGKPDPGLTREELRTKSDRDADAVRGLIEGWKEIDADGGGKTASKAIDLLKDKANASNYPVLREVLSDLFDLPAGKLPTPSKLGYVLRKYRGRNVGGACLDSSDGHGGVQVWAVRSIVGRQNRDGGDGGDGGDVTTIPTREVHPPSREKNTYIGVAKTSPPSPPSPPSTANGFHKAPQPPPGAKLHYADARGFGCGPEDAVKWCWAGGKDWIDAKQFPPPAFGGRP